ncbi:MAG: hypothetical protein V2A34_12365, partial [Lentisphaerota bacterium]
ISRLAADLSCQYAGNPHEKASEMPPFRIFAHQLYPHINQQNGSVFMARLFAGAAWFGTWLSQPLKKRGAPLEGAPLGVLKSLAEPTSAASSFSRC